jgi:DNA-binding response OmpR family regulator
MASRIAVVLQQHQGLDLCRTLQEAYYEAVPFFLTPSLGAEVQAYAPHLVLYDCQGETALRESAFRSLRATVMVPILVLGAQCDETFVVNALRLGAEDCLCAPYGIAELLARMEARMRRYWQWQNSAYGLREELLLKPAALAAVVGSQEVKLTEAEVRLLRCLVENSGRTVSHEELRQVIWDAKAPASTETLVSQMRALRAKIEPDPRHPQFIVTRWGKGYLLARRARIA